MKNNIKKIDAEIDLHGFTIDDAGQALYDFLDKSNKSGYNKIRVITGIGIHSSDGGGTLSGHIQDILTNKGYDYSYAPQSGGGDGAIDIDVRRSFNT